MTDFRQRAFIQKVLISFRGYNNVFGQIPESITFQVSDDGTSWTTVISKSTNVPTEGSAYSATPYSYTLNAQGRYLRLWFEELGQNPTTQTIILHEVEVYGEVNLAYSKTATAFSTVNDSMYSPAYAVDGIRYTPSDLHSWAWDNSCTNENGKTWCQIDLGGGSDIEGVKISYRGYNNVFGQIPTSITFQVSDDGQNWRTVINRSANVSVEGSSYSSTQYAYTLNTQGRYLRLWFEDLGQNQSTDAITLYEVEVYEWFTGARFGAFEHWGRFTGGSPTGQFIYGSAAEFERVGCNIYTERFQYNN